MKSSEIEALLRRSKSKEGKGSVDEKRGVFTSRYQVDQNKPNAKVYLDNSLGNSFGASLQANIRNSLQASKTSQQFKDYKVNVQPPKNHIFVKTTQQTNAPRHQNHHLHSIHETRKVEHPQVHFNYHSSKEINRSQSPIRYIPIQNHQTILPPPPPQEQVQIRRTLVPNKIYNYIPIGSTVAQSQTKQQPKYGDEAYEVLMKQYQKLYSKFQQEQQQNKQLSFLMQKIKSQKQTTQVRRQRGKISVNMQLLHDKLYGYYQQYLNGILNSHKQRCHERFSKLFEQASKQVVITEQVSTSQWIS